MDRDRNKRGRTICRRMIVPLVILVIGLILAAKRHDDNDGSKQGAKTKEEERARDAASEMGEWLLKEGEKRLVVSDPKGASDAARLAAFFGESADLSFPHDVGGNPEKIFTGSPPTPAGMTNW